MAILFRGVTKRTDEALNGVIAPHGSASAVAILADGGFLADGTATAGETVDNAARAHQIKAGLYGGSFVSFTTNREVAIDFATNHFSEPGYVYVIDASDLAGHCVEAKSFSDPKHPGEDEVSLRHLHGGPIPQTLIVRKILVDRDGVVVSVEG
ncbi:MAG: hypothetical protein ACN6PT_03475 [Stenotrophomonas geniculata]